MATLTSIRLLSALIAASALSSAAANATDFTVDITNLTRGSYFTPLLVSAHPAGSGLFSSGSAASTELQAMAEGGDISGLLDAQTAAGATVMENPAGGLLAPGASTQVTLNTDNAADNAYLSIVGMILPSNDGFVGLGSLAIPTEAGTYTYKINAHDAGTEANDEIRGSGVPGEAGYPAPGPVDTSSGQNGTGIDATIEGHVHIHRGVLGDTDAQGGASDIDAAAHRWLNPVAQVVITVN